MVTTYALWTASRNLAGNDALPTADPDHDGIPNLIAYLTGDGTLTMEHPHPDDPALSTASPTGPAGNSASRAVPLW